MTEQNRTVGQLEGLLAQRGVNGIEPFIEALGEGFNLDACFAAVRRYDQDGKDSPGLLVHRVRQAAKAPAVAVERQAAPSGELTPKLLNAVRGMCASLNGCTRDEARANFDAAAKVRGRSVDELIDAAMSSEWTVTRRDAAFDPELDQAERAVAYVRLLGGTGRLEPAPVQGAPSDVGGLRRLPAEAKPDYGPWPPKKTSRPVSSPPDDVEGLRRVKTIEKEGVT